MKLRTCRSQGTLAVIGENILSSSLLSNNLKIKIYRTAYNFAVILYGCETWSLALRHELCLRMFENRVPRKIFGRKRVEITEVWRKLNNEELGDPYYSLNIFRMIKSRIMRWAEHVTHIGYRRGIYWDLEGKCERMRPLERPMLRWKD